MLGVGWSVLKRVDSRESEGGPASAHITLLPLQERQGTKTKGTHRGASQIPGSKTFLTFCWMCFCWRPASYQMGRYKNMSELPWILSVTPKVFKVNLDLKRLTDCCEVQHELLHLLWTRSRKLQNYWREWVQVGLKHSSLGECKVGNVDHVLLRWPVQEASKLLERMSPCGTEAFFTRRM